MNVHCFFINLLSITTGACNTLRLTGGKQYPKGITLAKFRRQGPDAGLTTRYKSINDNDLEIFFVAELNAWAIGIVVFPVLITLIKYNDNMNNVDIRILVLVSNFLN